MAMPITKPAPKPHSGQTQAPKERKGVMRGHKEQITLTLPPETLTRLERIARVRGMTRAGLLNSLIHDGLDELEARSAAPEDGSMSPTPLRPNTWAEAQEADAGRELFLGPQVSAADWETHQAEAKDGA